MLEKNSEWEKQRVSVSGSAGGADKIPALTSSRSFSLDCGAGEQRDIKRPASRRLRQQPGGRADPPGGRAAEVMITSSVSRLHQAGECCLSGRTCLLDGQEQQPVGGQRHAEGAAGAGQRGQRGAQPGPPQAHGRLDQGEGGAGAEGVGLEEGGGGEGRSGPLETQEVTGVIFTALCFLLFLSSLSLFTATSAANTAGCWCCGDRWSAFGGTCAS